jgi:ComF family protein
MLTRLLTPLVQLFYPHCCELCGAELSVNSPVLCFSCIESLPATNFQYHTDNPVAKLFNGRIRIENAFSAYYYHHSSELRHLIHLFKYKKREEVAVWMGRQMGIFLKQSSWHPDIDIILPVPLFPKKEKLRGYNQAALLARGISEILEKPTDAKLLRRQQFAITQTRKGRVERWQNVAGAFIAEPLLAGKHVLLIDDVITTGATTEACCHALLLQGARVSIASLALTWH